MYVLSFTSAVAQRWKEKFEEAKSIVKEHGWYLTNLNAFVSFFTMQMLQHFLFLFTNVFSV